MRPLTDSFPVNLVQLRDALSEIGVAHLEICSWNQRHMLRARVPIHTGTYAGSTKPVGWSFPDNLQPFPEYAPHWFHIAGRYDDGKGGASEKDHDEDGILWLAWSRPIGPSWVAPYRTPHKLLRSTVARFWKAVEQ